MDIEQQAYPWERRPKESDQAWEAFLVYRDMPLGELSMRAVAKQLGKHESLIFKWSGQHEWVERRHIWDMEQDRRRQDAMASESIEMAKRHATNAAAYMRTLLLPAETLIRRLRTEAGIRDFEDLSTKELVQLTIASGRVFPLIMAAERIARGQTQGSQSLLRPTKGQEGAVNTNEEQLMAVFHALEQAGLTPGSAAVESTLEGEPSDERA